LAGVIKLTAAPVEGDDLAVLARPENRTRPSATMPGGSAAQRSKGDFHPLKLLVATTEVLNAAHQLTGFLWTLMGLGLAEENHFSPGAKTSRTVLSSRRRRY
jgi:hypothetical protein